jgi:diadenosine tetraphosphatase ApaH/serine/threonine PP2A family protein phosphatase
MRILVLSDIHANLTALETVINDADTLDAVWCLGDLVGYGPYPNECIRLVSSLPNLICLLGNHDAAALGRIDLETFNFEARSSIQWTHSNLTPESLDFLRNLPERKVLQEVTLVHGSPRNPVWEYIMEKNSAMENFDYFTTRLCFVGHTHFPTTFVLRDFGATVERKIFRNDEIEIITERMIINPGSVGQPRDHDPRASYGIFSSEDSSWEQRRVAYDVKHIQSAIDSIGLPGRNSLRLAGGW